MSSTPAGRPPCEACAAVIRLVLARKDLALAADEAQELGVRLRMVREAIAACDEAIAAGLGDEDNTAVARHVRSVGRDG